MREYPEITLVVRKKKTKPKGKIIMGAE